MKQKEVRIICFKMYEKAFRVFIFFDLKTSIANKLSFTLRNIDKMNTIYCGVRSCVDV